MTKRIKPRHPKKVNKYGQLCNYVEFDVNDYLCCGGDTPAANKIRYRVKNKLCVGCGKVVCNCKRKSN